MFIRLKKPQNRAYITKYAHGRMIRLWALFFTFYDVLRALLKTVKKSFKNAADNTVFHTADGVVVICDKRKGWADQSSFLRKRSAPRREVSAITPLNAIEPEQPEDCVGLFSGSLPAGS